MCKNVLASSTLTAARKNEEIARNTLNRKLVKQFVKNEICPKNLTDRIEVVQHTVAEAAWHRPKNNPP
jgi:hypothetical protein